MNEKTRLAIGIAAGAALLGIAGNWLLWTDRWGAGFALWMALCVAAAIALPRLARHAPLGAEWALVAAAFFAGAFAWRATPWLRNLDVMVAAVALSVPFWRGATGKLREVLPAEAAVGAASAIGGAIAGWGHAFDGEIAWKQVAKGGVLRTGVGVGLGLAIALPLVLIFGALFASADPHFKDLAKQMFDVKLEEWILHGFFFGLLLWGTGGFLFSLFWKRDGSSTPLARFGIGIVPVATVLVLLDALFGLFVALQLPYLFGGAGLVAVQEGLTYAEYARHGFFELVMVTTLSLPLMLGLHAAIGEGSNRAEWVFRALAGLLVVLLAVIVASATQRMALYQATYGWTTARLFVLAFEGWLAGVLVWFCLTVLRGHRRAFVFGTLVWGFVATAALHVPNWEGLIVHHNVALAAKGRPVDVGYLSELSLDAVPALVENLGTFQGDTGRRVGSRLEEASAMCLHSDWRSWTWAHREAWAAVESKQDEINKLTAPMQGPPDLRGYYRESGD